MKKKFSLFVVLAMLVSMLSLAGCGGGGDSASSKYDGTWVAVSADMGEIQMDVDEIGGMEFTITGSGKADMVIDGEEFKIKWEEEGDIFTLNIDGELSEGTIGENIITFEDMLGMGMTIIFAKEGTDAMDPFNYWPEEEKNMVGEWTADSATDVLKTPLDTVGGMAIADALHLSFAKDHQVAVTYLGQNLGSFPWSVDLGYCIIDTEGQNYSLYVTINDDGTIQIDYSDANDYTMFHCVKAQ